MIDKMVFTFKFANLPNIFELKSECKAWLISILDKFDPTRGFKAFSYFSVITKNWFIHQTKVIATMNEREISIDANILDESERNLITNNKYFEEQNKQDFFSFLFEEMDIWSNVEDLKESEKVVLFAIKGLLEEPDKIEMHSKKAVFVYLKEITNFSTKQITHSILKLKEKYFIFRKDWDEAKF